MLVTGIKHRHNEAWWFHPELKNRSNPKYCFQLLWSNTFNCKKTKKTVVCWTALWGGHAHLYESESLQRAHKIS